MVRAVYATLLVLSVSTHVTPQFFDFFGLQPIGPHTIRPFFQFDITTKRTRTHKTTRRPETTTKWNTPFSLYSDEFNRRATKRPETTTKRSTTFSFYSEDLEREKQKNKNAPAVYDYYSTTTKPSRKTTKSNPIRRHYDPNSRDSVSLNSNVNKVVSKETTNSNSGRNSQNNNSNTRNNKAKIISDTRNVNVQNIPKQQQSVYNTNDRLVFDDDGRRNTVINYETTKSIYTTKPIYTTKSPYIYQTTRKNVRTTSRPYTIRPGVKPAVVNGPPITNRPPTRRPSFGPQGVNDDVTPELIIGPNEDYMSTVEKKRYIELAERMCDKYKALDIKQIQAIPLVPSPDPVRVNVSTCTPIEAALVVGGRVASIQEFRHMVLLGWHKTQSGGYSWKCGGSLVSDRYVLTAAHCAYQDRDNSVAIGPPQMVQLGSSYLDDPGALVVRVAAVIRHPKYKLPKSYYDIALVKMARSVTFSSVIKPACLGIPPPPGKPIIATGWGRTEFGGDQSEELRSVSLPIWDMAECYNVLGTSRRLPEGPSSDSQICAGEKKGGKDTCQGDSGGPAQIQDGCSWRVVAVTSVGRSCGAAHTPALYAKVPRAFVSAVVFGEQSDSNNQYSNNNQQSNTNNQQSNNNNQQWNNQQSNNQSPQWNTNQQQPNLWDGQQQSNNQQQNNNNQQWNINQQPTNQWNSQQQPNNQQSNWNNNQQDNSWTWNRYQKEQNKNPLNNQQQSNNNQGTYNNQEQSKNNRNNQNVKRNDQNNYNNQNGQSNVYQSSNQNPNGYENSNNQNKRNNDQYNRGQSNNDYVTEKPVDNNQYGGYNYGYTTEEPIYNQYNGYNNGYTTQEPVYNQDSGYNNGYTTEKPVYNQHSGHNNGYTTEKPVYNQNSGYNTGYTTEKPVYNQPSYNNGYYSGDYGAVVPSGYQPHRVYNNDDRVWWT